jgi:tRNA-specific 2-thiouridylase
LYVVAIRPEDRAVVIGPRDELYGQSVVAREVNWLVPSPPSIGAHVEVQVRHRAAAVPATISRLVMDGGPDAGRGGEIELSLDTPVAAIAPGQSVVLYAGDRVLGGGVIEGQ